MRTLDVITSHAVFWTLHSVWFAALIAMAFWMRSLRQPFEGHDARTAGIRNDADIRLTQPADDLRPLRAELQRHARLIDQLHYEIVRTRARPEDVDVHDHYREPAPPSHTIGPVRFYASMPDEQGLFIKRDLRSEPDAWAIYEIQTDRDYGPGTEGILRLHGNLHALQSALHAHRAFLSPACEYTDLPSATTMRVDMLAPGTVVFEGDWWRVRQKVRIRISD